MWSIDDHKIRDVSNSNRKCAVRDVLRSAESFCANAEEAEPLARQLLARIHTARDACSDATPDATERSLQLFEDVLVKFTDAVGRYLWKVDGSRVFVDQLLQHQHLIQNLQTVHRKLDDLHKLLHVTPSEWQPVFEEAVVAFSAAMKTRLEDEKTRKQYQKADSRLALEAAILLRLAQQSVDPWLWDKNPLAQQLWGAMKTSYSVNVPEWFIPESEVTYRSHAFSKGSFGTAHYGVMGSGANVVVKRLIPDERTDPKLQRQRLIKEADIWHKIRHPYVLRLWGACHVAIYPIFVSEEAVEGTLSAYLAKDRSKMWRQLLQTAQTLEYLHGKNIIHRDLKLGNVFVVADGSVRLADFGLSDFATASSGETDESAGNSGEVGTLRYCAPEALNPTNQGQIESDVYSFAMCIVEALSGSVPYVEMDDEAVVAQKMQGILPGRPANASDKVWDLVKKMTSIKSEERATLKDAIWELTELANEERDRELKSIRRCETCNTSVESGSSKCSGCSRAVDSVHSKVDVAPTSIQAAEVRRVASITSKDDVPKFIQMAALSDGNKNQNAPRVLNDYVGIHPEGWFDVVDGGAISVFCTLIRDKQGNPQVKADALKALGSLIVTTQMDPLTDDVEEARQTMKNVMEIEKVAELFKTQLKSTSEILKGIAVRTLGFWPQRDEITEDPEVMALMHEIANKFDSPELRRSASFALNALAPEAPVGA